VEEAVSPRIPAEGRVLEQALLSVVLAADEIGVLN